MLIAKLATAFESRIILPAVLLLPSMLAAQTPAPLCDDDPDSALVFVGTLTEIRPEYSGKDWTSAVFHITEPLFPGSVLGEDVLVEIQNRRCKNQKTTPRIGESYFIWTHTLVGSGPPVVGNCEQMRPANQASAEIEYFRSVKKGDAPTEVIWDTRGDLGYPGKRVPVPNTAIQAVSGGKTWDFVSDRNGFIRAAISPGEYSIEVQFPKGYEPYYPPLHMPRDLIIGHVPSCAPSEFTIVEHLCTTVVLCGEPTGSISTHVVDVDGTPLYSGVQLTLEAANDQEFVQSVYSEENGRLDADRLLPGKYLLGLSTYIPPLDDQPPYPPTYYPGVSLRSEAQVINLRAGEQKVLPQMRIKKGTACQITVKVVDERGNPSPDTEVGFAYPDYPHFWIKDNPTEKDGTTKVFAVFPGKASLRAEKPDNDHTMLESDVTELTSCPGQPVLLILSHRVSDPQEPHAN